MDARNPPRPAARAVLGLRRLLVLAADRLVPGEVALWDKATGSLIITRILGALTELGVADELARGPASAEALAARLDLDADALHRALSVAALNGVVRTDRRGRFRLTSVGQALRTDHDPSMADWIRYLNLGSTQRAWAGVTDTLRTGKPSFPAVHGRSVWDHFAANPGEERLFAAAMRRFTERDAPIIAAAYPWPVGGTVCDVAGGVGTLLAGILDAHPTTRGILVDAPGVLSEAEDYLTSRGLRERVTLREGNFFERIEAQADFYILKDVLHDWDDDRCLAILGTVRRTMAPGSRLILVETPLETNRPHPIASLVDIHMMTQTDGGRQRSVGQLQEMLRRSGLDPGEIIHTALPSLVEGIAR